MWILVIQIIEYETAKVLATGLSNGTQKPHPPDPYTLDPPPLDPHHHLDPQPHPSLEEFCV